MRHVSTGLQADRLVTIAFILGKQELPLFLVGFDRLKGCGKCQLLRMNLGIVGW